MRMNRHEPHRSAKGESRIAALAVIFLYCMFGMMFFLSVGCSKSAVVGPNQADITLQADKIKEDTAIEIGKSCIQYGYWIIVDPATSQEFVFLCSLNIEDESI